jgi:hypothetical protein
MKIEATYSSETSLFNYKRTGIYNIVTPRNLGPDNLTAICDPIVLENVGTSTSHNPMGLHGLLQE